MRTSKATATFLAVCHYQDLARATLANYRWALNRLESHCPELPRKGDQLLPVVGARELSRVSKQDLRRILGRFFKWTAKKYRVPNPVLDLEPLPKSRRILPEVLEEYQVRRLMAAAGQGRDLAMVAVVLDTGIRLGELAGLHQRDVGDQLRVHGKTGARQVPISDRIRELLRDQGDGPLWIGRKGPLTTEGVRQVFERVFARAGITGRKCKGPHILRHTFGTMYCRAGGNVRILQEIMGHQDIQTTMIYVHLAGRDVTKDHAQFSPITTLELVA